MEPSRNINFKSNANPLPPPQSTIDDTSKPVSFKSRSMTSLIQASVKDTLSRAAKHSGKGLLDGIEVRSISPY